MLDHILSFAPMYRAVQWLFGGPALRKRLFRDSSYHPGERVLDIGCGPGDLAPLFHCQDYTGIDISPRYIEFARRNYRGEFHALAAEDIGQLTGSYDLALMLGVFHHMSDAKVRQSLQGLWRVLRPGGRFLLLEALWPSRWYDLPGWVVRKLDRGKFVRTEQQWRSLLGNSPWNLTDMHIFRCGVLEVFQTTLRPVATSIRQAS